MPPYYIKHLVLCFIIITPSYALNACSESTPALHTNNESFTLTDKLSELYMSSCHNCHNLKTTGAPLIGDQQAWQKILAKGIDETLDRAMNGYGGMPPAGQCFECSPAQIKSLIIYMSQAKR
jgi:cytochrome c5